jgi:serine/threonine protein kinase
MHTGLNVGGRYQLGTKLGSGGMGTVWRAYDQTLERVVAVKEIRIPSTVSDEVRMDLSRRAMLEARSAARLNHPNIVTVHDVLVESDKTWIVMNLINGRSLLDTVIADGRLTPAKAAEIGLGLLDALDAAHAAGILHRDVKPSNVLLPKTGGVLLTDFSIAALADAATVTGTNVLLGTPGYVAPERVTSGQSGPAVDLFGLGATLYFATETVGPFERPDKLAALFATVNAEPNPPRWAGSIAEVILGLLHKDPRERWTSTRARPALLAAIDSPPDALRADVAAGAPSSIAAPPVGGSRPDPTRAIAPDPVIGRGRVPTRHLPEPLPPDDTTLAGRLPVAFVSPRQRRRNRLILAALSSVVLVGAAAVLALRPHTPTTDAPPDRSASRAPGTVNSTGALTNPASSSATPSPTGSPVSSRPGVIGAAKNSAVGYGLGSGGLPFWSAGDGHWHVFYGGATIPSKPNVTLITHDVITPANLGKGSISAPDALEINAPAVQQPVALVGANGMYFLFYFQFPSVFGDQGPLYAATSTDLNHWTSRGVVIGDMLLLSGGFDVVSYGGQFLAFSGTSAGTSLRTSTNLLTWSTPTFVGLGVSHDYGVFPYRGSYYLAGAVDSAGDTDLIRAADPTSFGTGVHLRVEAPALASGWEGPLSHVLLGPSGQPYDFGESGWWSPLDWSA